MALSATQTIRQLATEIPNATRIFEKLGIDYCCGGAKTLEAACAQAKIPVDDVLQSLKEGSAPVASAGESPDVQQAALASLASYIVATHHAYVKQEIPRLEKLL